MDPDDTMEILEDGDELAVRDCDEVFAIVLPGDAVGGDAEEDLLAAEGDVPEELDF